MNLKAAVLRHMDKPDDALEVLATASQKADPLDVRIMAEKWLATKSPKIAKTMVSVMDESGRTARRCFHN